MTDRRSTIMWRGGVPLNRAWIELANADSRSAYDALPSAPEAFRDSTDIASEERFWSRLGSAAAAFGSASMARSNAEWELKSELAGRVSNGEFEVLGYRLEPNKSRGPIKIADPDFQKYPPDWKNETVEIRGEFYSDIRLAPPESRPSPRRGRPGSRDIIRAAVDELYLKAPNEFCDLPRKQAAEKIRDLLRINGIRNVNQKGAGLSDKNLEELIRERCGNKELKFAN